MSEPFEAPVLSEGAAWRCEYCGESFQFQTHPGCLKNALSERDAARGLARWLFERTGFPDQPGEAQRLLLEYSWLARGRDDPTHPANRANADEDDSR